MQTIRQSQLTDKQVNEKDQLILSLSQGLIQNQPLRIKEELMRGLENICRHFSAQRVIIFTINWQKNQFSCKYEYHTENVPSVSRFMQGLSFDDYALWGKFANRRNYFYIHDTDNIPDSYPLDKRLFSLTASRSFLQIPIIFQDSLKGFMAISHQDRSYEFSSPDIQFLKTASEMFTFMLLKTEEKLSIALPNHFSSYEQKKKKINKTREKEFSDESFKESEKHNSPVIKQKFNESASEKKETLKNETPDVNKIFESVDYGVAIFDLKKDDFQFVNSRFAQLFNFEPNKPDKRESIFKVFRDSGYNTKDFFSYYNYKISKDFSLTFNDKYLTGNVNHVTNSETLVVSLQDITPVADYEKVEKIFNRQLRILSETAIALFSQKPENIYKFIGETAYKLTGNGVVIVNEYNKQEGFLQTRFVKGIGFSINAITKLLGKHPLNKKYPLDMKSEHYKRIISYQLQNIEGGIHELSLGNISQPVASKIEKHINTNKYFMSGLYVNDTLYGSISFMMRSDSFANNYIMETFSRMVSHALHADKVDQELKHTSALLTNASRIARMGYWQYHFCTKTLVINKPLFAGYSTSKRVKDIKIPFEVFLRKYLSPEDAVVAREKFEIASKNTNNENYTFDLEWKFLRKNNPPVYIYSKGVVQQGGWIMGIAQDISEMKKVELNLWESESKFKNLIDQSLDSIIVIQDDGKITEWNPQTEKLTLIPARNVLDKNVWDIEMKLIYKPQWKDKPALEVKEKLRRRFFQFFSMNHKTRFLTTEISIKNSIDEVKELSVTSFVFNANQRKYLCRISKDITLLKKAREREKQKEITKGTAEAKELFLDNMSHEMRTPLGGIIGMTEILMHSGLNEHQFEMLKVVKESSDSLLELISNIHEISTIDANKIVIHKREFVLRHLLEKILSTFRAVATQKSIKFQMINNAPSHLVLVGDDFRLQQVLTNLVGNALKFTPTGGEVTLEAHVQKKSDLTSQLRFVVKDTGIGITDDKTSILFEKFTQADSSYTRQHDGAGIGLYISRQIIEMMGGKIGVTSQINKGSTFWIQINLPTRN
ncbi:MAG: ATP-binding protein [Bacteroidota bacterium]